MIEKNHKKLSIACIHIVDWKRPAILVSSIKPIDDKDSGKLYICEECEKCDPKELMPKLDNWKTICEDCIKPLLKK